MISVTGKRSVGIPTLLFHEGEGMTLTIETKDNILYRGKAENTEDNMNISLTHVTVTYPDGRKTSLERVFIRGGQIVFVIYPDILCKAPYFERFRKVAAGEVQAVGLGRNRVAAIQAKVIKRAIRGPGSSSSTTTSGPSSLPSSSSSSSILPRGGPSTVNPYPPRPGVTTGSGYVPPSMVGSGYVPPPRGPITVPPPNLPLGLPSSSSSSSLSTPTTTIPSTLPYLPPSGYPSMVPPSYSTGPRPVHPSSSFTTTTNTFTGYSSTISSSSSSVPAQFSSLPSSSSSSVPSSYVPPYPRPGSTTGFVPGTGGMNYPPRVGGGGRGRGLETTLPAWMTTTTTIPPNQPGIFPPPSSSSSSQGGK